MCHAVFRLLEKAACAHLVQTRLRERSCEVEPDRSKAVLARIGFDERSYGSPGHTRVRN
jgi:hypothetical protein